MDDKPEQVPEQMATGWPNALAPALENVAEENEAIRPLPPDFDVGGALDQSLIDNLLGFKSGEVADSALSGIRALTQTPAVPYERVPMLEAVFERLVRLLRSSVRGLTSDNVEVSLEHITSVRFGSYLQSIPLPAVIAIVKAEPWNNFGLLTMDSSLIYSIVDLTLGGSGERARRVIEGRSFTTIEMSIVRNFFDVVLADTERAFSSLSPVTFSIDHFEMNPRFANIAQPANVAALARFKVEIGKLSGYFEFLMPYATLEPIRDVLAGGFIGEKLGRDAIWEEHLATEVWQAEIEICAILHECKIPLKQIMELEIGETLILDRHPDDPVELRCGHTVLTEGRIGRFEDMVAVQVMRPLRRSRTTLEMYEGRRKRAG